MPQTKMKIMETLQQENKQEVPFHQLRLLIDGKSGFSISVERLVIYVRSTIACKISFTTTDILSNIENR